VHRGNQFSQSYGCNDDCSQCEYIRTTAYGCRSLTRLVPRERFGVIPRISSKGLICETHFGQCRDKPFMQFYVQDEWCNSPGSQEELKNFKQAHMPFLGKYMNQEFRSNRATWDSTKNGAHFLYYDAPNCRGNLVKELFFENSKCVDGEMGQKTRCHQ
jgi:hypothetical protein